jgi:microcystin-dependent protein
MTLYKWSQTAAANGSADSTCPFPEGMAPSAVNDSDRSAMAAVAKYRDDTAGGIVTAGTNVAYTVSSYEVFDSLAHLHGQVIAFSPHATNGATVTLNVDSLGAKPLRSAPGAELLAATIIQGTPYVAIYNNTDGAFYLQGFYGASVYNVPFLGGMDFWGTTAPNSNFAFPAGQALSRTVYAAAFAVWGTAFGAGDGSTTFNIPDKTGRVSAMLEASASRLTSSYFGGVSTALGAGGVGGGESHALTLGETPAGIASSGSNIITVASQVGSIPSGANASSRPSTGGPSPTIDGATITSVVISVGANTIGVVSTNTGGAAHRTVQPTIVCNYIIRII